MTCMKSHKLRHQMHKPCSHLHPAQQKQAKWLTPANARAKDEGCWILAPDPLL